MLQPGDDLRVTFELPDEVRIVRELRLERLDRDLPVDLGLQGSIDHSERTASDPFEHPVAAKRLPAKFERRVLSQDLLLQPLELGGWIDTELVGKQLARGIEGAQGAALTARPVASEHQVLPQTLSKRVFVN